MGNTQLNEPKEIIGIRNLNIHRSDPIEELARLHLLLELILNKKEDNDYKIDLVCPCPVEGCINKNNDNLKWRHSKCGGYEILTANSTICKKCGHKAPLIDCVFKCEQHGFQKPSIQGYIYAVSRIGIKNKPPKSFLLKLSKSTNEIGKMNWLTKEPCFLTTLNDNIDFIPMFINPFINQNLMLINGIDNNIRFNIINNLNDSYNSEYIENDDDSQY